MPTPRDRSLLKQIGDLTSQFVRQFPDAKLDHQVYSTAIQDVIKLLAAALGGDDCAPQVDVRDSDDFNWALDRIDEIVRTLRVNVQKPDDRDANSVWSWRLDMWADALDSVYSDLRKLRETQLAALPRHDTGSRNEHVEDAGVERAKNPNTDRSRSASTE